MLRFAYIVAQFVDLAYRGCYIPPIKRKNRYTQGRRIWFLREIAGRDHTAKAQKYRRFTGFANLR